LSVWRCAPPVMSYLRLTFELLAPIESDLFRPRWD